MSAGRSPPQITADREHHPYCFSGLLAGGGIRGGTVYGTSDAQVACPVDNPVSPHDLTATMMHALGIPADLRVPDQTGRPCGHCDSCLLRAKGFAEAGVAEPR